MEEQSFPSTEELENIESRIRKIEDRMDKLESLVKDNEKHFLKLLAKKTGKMY